MNEPQIVVNSGDMGIVIAFVLLLGGIIKNYTPVKNELIPLITWALGGLIYQWLAGGWNDPRQWMMALLSVAGATGLHSASQSTMSVFKKDDNTPPTIPLVLLVGLLAFGLMGCGTTERLQANGAYAASATQAAQPELFALDASFDLAYTALDRVFQYERDNRKMLWQLSPNIKRALDKLRREAGVARDDYALARTLYLEQPTPAGLTEVQEALSKLQRANGAALQVIEKKGNQ